MLIKTGVGVGADLRKISEQQRCVAKGHVELQARTHSHMGGMWHSLGHVAPFKRSPPQLTPTPQQQGVDRHSRLGG